MAGYTPDARKPIKPDARLARLKAAMVRAVPRVSAATLAAIVAGLCVTGGVPGISAPIVTGLWLALTAVAVPSSPKRWWHYVKHGRPPTWQLTHGGTTRLFVTDPGPHHVSVAACLREHGPLDLGEAVRRLDDPTRPIWDDLTVDSAHRLGALLEQSGAAVVIDLGRDLTTDGFSGEDD